MGDVLGMMLICGLAYACGRYAAPLLGGMCLFGVGVGGMALLGGDNFVPLVLATVAPWLGGFALRKRHDLLASLAARTRELEDEQRLLARLSVQQERARIARELHDIVAHHLAVIVVQAGAGRMSSEERDKAAQRVTVIRQAGEQALTEMERLVDLLQTGTEGGGHRIDVLLDQAQVSGLNLRTAPIPIELSLSPDAERLAYFVIREGLTNVIKHAPGSEVYLRISATDDELEIQLMNSAGERASSLAATGSGLGLNGLRERLEPLGGHLEATPETGGWCLRARIPTLQIEDAASAFRW